jgi:hypothetical protein
MSELHDLSIYPIIVWLVPPLGMEEGYHMSIEGQVNSLIQQATDPENLALLFPGWQSFV